MAANDNIKLKPEFQQKRFFTEKLYILLIILIPSVVWSPIIFTIFFNDDFQLIGWCKPDTLIDCLKPFWTQDISGVYWRPVINSIHAFVQYIFGFSPLPFRVLTIIVYIVICLQIFKLLRVFKISLGTSFFMAILFSLSPSHEIIVGWIAGRDLFALFFLNFAVIFYLKSLIKSKVKNYLLSVLFFLLAILTKEIAFMGLFLPLILMFLSDNINLKLNRGFISFLVLILLTGLIYIYRVHLTGASLLSSPNIANPDIITIAKNFFIYIFLAFISPELLEQFYFNTTIVIISIVILIGFTVYFYFKKYFDIKLSENNKKLILFGLVWYIIFIIPALPMLMRWYVFVASVGLIVALGALFENYFVYNIKRREFFLYYQPIVLTTIIAIIITVSLYNFDRMIQWKSAGLRTDKILQSLISYDFKNTKQVVLWASPDKFNWVNALKVGIHSAVHYYTGNYELDVYAPLRYEGDVDAKINIEIINNDRVVLITKTGRFIFFGQKFTTILRNQKSSKKFDDFEITIWSWKQNKNFYSKAEILFKRKDKLVKNLFFDGEQFRII